MYKKLKPPTDIFSSLYLCSLTVEIFDVSNLDYTILYRVYSSKYLRSTTLVCKEIGIRNQRLWQRLHPLKIMEYMDI